MSKMSQLHVELTEQAAELGFESIYEAEQSGYRIDWEKGRLVEAKSTPEEELEKAHEAWSKEREIILGDLMNLMIHKVYDHDIIKRAYLFIKEQCHD